MLAIAHTDSSSTDSLKNDDEENDALFWSSHKLNL